MEKNSLQFLLTGFQYLSIIFSGILGMFGVIFSYKDKETGKLTKSGKVALILLFISLGLGLTSKIVEQTIKQKAEASEAARARIAAEQSLNISRNVERVVNAIQTINVDIDFEIDFNSPAFTSFKDDIEKRIGESWNDRDFSPAEFTALIPGTPWKQLVRELTFIDPVLKIYPKGSPIPRCISESDAPLELTIPFRIDNIEIPQQESRIRIMYSGIVNILRRNSSQILSLVDFKGVTIIGYMFLAIKGEIPTLRTGSSAKDFTPFEKQFPSTAWKFNGINFSFENGRNMSVYPLEQKQDKCTGQPIFVAQLEN